MNRPNANADEHRSIRAEQERDARPTGEEVDPSGGYIDEEEAYLNLMYEDIASAQQMAIEDNDPTTRPMCPPSGPVEPPPTVLHGPITQAIVARIVQCRQEIEKIVGFCHYDTPPQEIEISHLAYQSLTYWAWELRTAAKDLQEMTNAQNDLPF